MTTWLPLLIAASASAAIVYLSRLLRIARLEVLMLERTVAALLSRTSLIACDQCGATLDIHRGDPIGVRGTPQGVEFLCAEHGPRGRS